MLWVTKVAENGLQIWISEFQLIVLETRKSRKHDPDKTDLFLFLHHEKRKNVKRKNLKKKFLIAGLR